MANYEATDDEHDRCAPATPGTGRLPGHNEPFLAMRALARLWINLRFAEWTDHVTDPSTDYPDAMQDYKRAMLKIAENKPEPTV